jgi:hypothetical protein
MKLTPNKFLVLRKGWYNHKKIQYIIIIYENVLCRDVGTGRQNGLRLLWYI